MSIITIVNNKGGVGKTTIAMHLGYFLYKKNRILMIDLDPQSNLTNAIIGKKKRISIYDCLINNNNARDVMVKVKNNFYILPSNLNLKEIDPFLYKNLSPKTKLKNKIGNLIYEFDICIIDNSPSLGILMQNSLYFATHILIPVIAEPFSLMGITGLENMLEESRKYHPIKVLGTIINNFDSRKKMHKDVAKELQNFPNLCLFDSKIRTNSFLAKNQIVNTHDFHPNDEKGKNDFDSFAKEVINRL